MAVDPEHAGMPSLLMQAAQSAAQADGLLPASAPSSSTDAAGMSKASATALQQARSAIAAASERKQAAAAAACASSQPAGGIGVGGKKKGPPLRRGKWTPEEEAYANRLIQEFKAGLLPLTDGTTLRTFLSKLLNCDPMRISKKFVGGNCIGKQVFRRRNADLNRLTPEQIQQNRSELSELERRFLERVAQTNRVKSSGVGGGAAGAGAGGGATNNAAAPPGVAAALAGVGVGAVLASANIKMEDNDGKVAAGGVGGGDPPTPPWLQPPLGYKHGTGAAFAAANLSGANSRAAAAGRALLGGLSSVNNNNNNNSGSSNSFKDAFAQKQQQALRNVGSAGLLAMVEMQQREKLLQDALNSGSASNLFASAARSGSSGGLSGNTMAQLAQSASAARLAGLSSNPSMNSLMLKTGLSRDQLAELVRDRGLSSGSLSNMIQRQSSFDALMSLDFQSLQSIDNLANLMQTGGSTFNVPETGMKNADFGGFNAVSRQNLVAAAASDADLSTAARRLASAGRMESLLKTLSSNNMRGVSNDVIGFTGVGGGIGNNSGSTSSNANLNNLLQSLQANAGHMSAASLFGAQGQSAVSLANLLRQDSSTGLTALRFQDGLNQRNSSVDDFLSLVAAGDIPHQDPGLLNVPLMQQQQQQNQQLDSSTQHQQQQEAAARLLAQQQMLQAATSNAALANALSSFGNFQSVMSNAANSGGGGGNIGGLGGSPSQLMAMAQAQMETNKRKLEELTGSLSGRGNSKR